MAPATLYGSDVPFTRKSSVSISSAMGLTRDISSAHRTEPPSKVGCTRMSIGSSSSAVRSARAIAIALTAWLMAEAPPARAVGGLPATPMMYLMDPAHFFTLVSLLTLSVRSSSSAAAMSSSEAPAMCLCPGKARGARRAAAAPGARPALPARRPPEAVGLDRVLPRPGAPRRFCGCRVALTISSRGISGFMADEGMVASAPLRWGVGVLERGR
mmetsp:Transcript_10832/g.27887  ORF Transcript_10832/g.27887 Transcript_10832/m.27887 type:complete len:214 (+) Transcript_10832:398-1039(+)